MGSTGYVGGELARLLSQHRKAEINFLDSRSYVGLEYGEVYPNLRDIISDKCVSVDLEKALEDIDLLFCALPHKLSQPAVRMAYKKGKKVIDISADFRLKNYKTYEKWYETKHESKEELQVAIYGLSEIYGDEIAQAQLVANPGCYPTSVLLPLYPLFKERLLMVDKLIVDSKSGVSGAGRSVTDGNLFSQCQENLRAYGIASHRHLPEIEQELSIAANEDIKIQFTPHLVPMIRGILSTIYIENKRGVSYQDIRDVYNNYYKDQPFIRLLDQDEYPQTKAVYGSNYCDIGVKLDKRTNNIILISVIDNLVKGAAGQAIQNMNIMCGFNIAEGLQQPALWP